MFMNIIDCGPQVRSQVYSKSAYGINIYPYNFTRRLKLCETRYTYNTKKGVRAGGKTSDKTMLHL